MTEAKKFLKAKGLKDTLYNVNYNPNQNRGVPQKEWIKGGLSALLNEYHESKVNELKQSSVIKSLPSDEEIKNEDRNINGMLTEKESEIWRDGARHLREMVRKLGNV